MKLRLLLLLLLLSTLFVLPTLVQSNSQSDSEPARIFRGSVRQPLTGPSNASPVAIVAQFLRGHGRDSITVGSIVSVAHQKRARDGITQARMEQRVSGLWIYDTYLKAAITDRGELIHLIEKTVLVAGGPIAARIDERQALRAALQHLHPTLNLSLRQIRREGADTVVFAGHSFFHTEPTVRRVAISLSDGTLATGFLVQTWTEASNLLHETLVSGDGAVLSVELRTNTDSYNIFPIDPEKGAQTITPGPGSGGNAYSPIGWLGTGAQTTINITGNNAHAYLDTDANNAPDAGGTPVTDGNFLTAANLSVAPTTSDNQNVAVQNLFFHNNIIHDLLYQHGFDEAAGNFQENNFGLGPRRSDSDSVNAEAQDGGGTDNANFATPRDGQNPRMQMFLWTGKPSHEVVVGSISYAAAGAEFGPALDATGTTAQVAEANDEVAPTSDACEALPAGSLTGNLALIDRGTCTFVVKVKNAQDAGAVGVIMVNNAGDSVFTMGGVDATITIPSVLVGQTDGNAIRAAIPTTATIRLKDPPALQRDGDLDSDIIYHEYGHGLTWRMIGRMSGPMSGAIGEGMSDVLAIVINNNDRVGEYSFSDPIGIRSAPYTNYPRTYGDVAGTQIHFDGEVYAAIGWRLLEIFQANGLNKDDLLGYMVDGMNFTPTGPNFEEMRDGILQSVANSNPGHECLIWEAFAQYGVGVGAQGRVRGSSVVITESFTKPAQCLP
jgi:extracellular elastinolytic metalloproteinase